MALLRGANRPLLTRLIQNEVELEWKKCFRPEIEIDLASEKVIQCGGDLALLAHDDIVRSIGLKMINREVASNRRRVAPMNSNHRGCAFTMSE